MAIINALRFGPQSGALCIDEESWFLMRRKTMLAGSLYRLVPEEIARRTGTELVYGGVGYPAFHAEVARRARAEIARVHAGAAAPVPAVEMSHCVVRALREAHGRRVNDRLRFLYGFDRDALVQGACARGDRRVEIRQPAVRDRALKIVEGAEDLGYGPLTTRNQALLAGIDSGGFAGFCLKEEDGVLSFQSCGFDTIGQGRYGAAAEFAAVLSRMTLGERRAGLGERRGLLVLLLAMLEPAERYGQVGGGLHLALLDAAAEGPERVRLLAGERLRLAREIALACRHELLGAAAAEELLGELLLQAQPLEAVEARFFAAAADLAGLDKLLRGYKPGAELPLAPGLAALYGVRQALAGRRAEG